MKRGNDGRLENMESEKEHGGKMILKHLNDIEVGNRK